MRTTLLLSAAAACLLASCAPSTQRIEPYTATFRASPDQVIAEIAASTGLKADLCRFVNLSNAGPYGGTGPAKFVRRSDREVSLIISTTNPLGKFGGSSGSELKFSVEQQGELTVVNGNFYIYQSGNNLTNPSDWGSCIPNLYKIIGMKYQQVQ